MGKRKVGKRGKTWTIKTKPELFHPVLTQKHKLSSELIKKAYYHLDRMYERVAKVLDDAGVFAQQRLMYRCFAEELWRITTNFRSETLKKLAYAIKCLYVNYGCDEGILNQIAGLFGLTLPSCAAAPTPTPTPAGYSLIALVYDKGNCSPLADALVKFEWDTESVEKTTDAEGKAKVEDAIPKDTSVKVTVSKTDYKTQSKTVTITQDEALMFLMETAFNYEITIDNSNNPNDLSAYQILLKIEGDSQFFADCENEKKYLEFYDEDKATLLNHFVELWDTANYNAKIWIKVPSIPANSIKKIYLKINKQRTEDLSNPDEVFDFFDNFERTDYSEKWDLISGAEPYIENGKLVFPNEDSTIRTKKQVTLAYNGIWQFKYRWKAVAGGYTPVFHFRFIFIDENNYYFVNLDAIDSTGYNRLRKKVAGSVSNLATLDFAADTKEHLIEVIRKGDGTFVVKQDGTVYAEVTDNDLTESVAIEMRHRENTNGQGIEIDDIIIRKYTEPEPTVTYTKL